ncbi:MAG TPA: glycoside hydrolase family 2 TIM barrel-domain containing protein [Verrucomicrobiae bacterium]
MNRMVFSAGALLLACSLSEAADRPPQNIALTAQASAFESYQGMTPNLANDGSMDTRWSGVPGHNTGGWYELEWDQPVRVGEVIIFQHDRYVKEMDLQVWDQDSQAWVTLEHLGTPDARLPRVVVCRFKSRSTRRVRLANITNGPSFTEVQVFENAFSHPPAVNLASDANGNFIGMVSDEWGSAPVAGAEVWLKGGSKSGPWQNSARSDDYGLFFVPMPLGLTGQVSVSTRIAQSTTPPGPPSLFDAAEFQYGLSPEDIHRRTVSLNGLWRFSPDPPADFWEPAFDDGGWSDITVPGHFVMQGFQSLNGIGGYRKHFRAPGGHGRLKLRFEGVYSGAEVWLNGRRLAYHEGGALPFEVDITDEARTRDNVLAVRVAEHTVVSDQLDKMSEYADFPLAGIMRPVYMFRVPPIHLGALAVTTAFDKQYRDVSVTAHVAVLNESSKALPAATIEFRMLDANGKTVSVEAKPASLRAPPWQRTETTVSWTVTAPRQWEAEHPNRYTLEATLRADGGVLDRVSQKIGFRQTEVRDGQLLINGRPVKIRGTCHHDSYPLSGRAVTAELARQDIVLMKEANLNSLRTSHYPPLPPLLDVADELGLYIEDEGSFCWVSAAADLRLTPRLMQLNAELLARDRNHPSVFIWSVCNESAFGYGFERSHDWLRKTDPSRPNAGSYDRGSLEILARHNPITIADIAELEKANKPVLWDECWCIFQGIWGDVAEMWLDPGIRDYYAEPLPAIYARMMQSKTIAGTQIWAWSDDIFCVPNRGLEYGRQATPSHFIENEYRLPDRGLVGDAPWGVVDGWRRKKPEFWITKKLHSPVKIKDAPIEIPEPGQSIRLAVENQYDFTDLAELTLRWRIGGQYGVAHGALAPRQSGSLEVTPSRMPVAGEVLDLEIWDGRGHVVDAYSLPFGPRVDRTPSLRSAGSAPLRIIRENYLAGPGTRVVGDDFELCFDQASGRLRRAVGFGQSLLLELPHVYLLAAAAPPTDLPNVLSWRLQDFSIKHEGPNVRVQLKGAYTQLEGAYDVLITPEGTMTIRSFFKYSGEKLHAREVGLAFSVPRECDLLRWQRRAEWSVYPADHIGRPVGETRAFARHGDQLPPTWPWAADNSPMGCNDFRSTKRHIDWASVSYPRGPGVWVESGGSQHLRAMVEPDRISVHVSDWYGGTHAGLWEWTSNYGEGKAIAPGDTIESTLRFRLAEPRPSPVPTKRNQPGR